MYCSEIGSRHSSGFMPNDNEQHRCVIQMLRFNPSQWAWFDGRVGSHLSPKHVSQSALVLPNPSMHTISPETSSSPFIKQCTQMCSEKEAMRRHGFPRKSNRCHLCQNRIKCAQLHRHVSTILMFNQLCSVLRRVKSKMNPKMAIWIWGR
jgi:hypothetical protein